MSTATKKYTLKSSEEVCFEVDEEVAQQSQTIKHLIEDECADGTIPLPNVSTKILEKVLKYCRKHVHATVDEDTKEWDADFVESVDEATLFDIILAAHYLDIKGLLDLTCQTVADMMKGKTVEEIRDTFNIQNDFTAEEEEKIRSANRWAFE